MIVTPPNSQQCSRFKADHEACTIGADLSCGKTTAGDVGKKRGERVYDTTCRCHLMETPELILTVIFYGRDNRNFNDCAAVLYWPHLH